MFKVILRAKAAASGCKRQKATALDQGGIEDTLATGCPSHLFYNGSGMNLSLSSSPENCRNGRVSIPSSWETCETRNSYRLCIASFSMMMSNSTALWPLDVSLGPQVKRN